MESGQCVHVSQKGWIRGTVLISAFLVLILITALACLIKSRLEKQKEMRLKALAKEQQKRLDTENQFFNVSLELVKDSLKKVRRKVVEDGDEDNLKVKGIFDFF